MTQEINQPAVKQLSVSQMVISVLCFGRNSGHLDSFCTKVAAVTGQIIFCANWLQVSPVSLAA